VASKWDITKAVRASSMPAPARLVMFVLADISDAETAVIPAQWTLSLAELAAETGLAESTVKRHLNDLEERGWVVRSRPTLEAARRGERTRYSLAVGGPVASPPPGPAVSPEVATGGPPDGPEGPTESPGGGPTESPKRSPTKHQTKTRSEASEPARLDIERVCQRLADRIASNGSKRPTITEKWRESARLLIDKDGRTAEQVLRAIDWCQDSEFWRANVMSMPKLREQYDRLRLEAQRERAVTKPSTTDQRVNAALALKRQMRTGTDRSITT